MAHHPFNADQQCALAFGRAVVALVLAAASATYVIAVIHLAGVWK